MVNYCFFIRICELIKYFGFDVCEGCKIIEKLDFITNLSVDFVSIRVLFMRIYY